MAAAVHGGAAALSSAWGWRQQCMGMTDPLLLARRSSINIPIRSCPLPLAQAEWLLKSELPLRPVAVPVRLTGGR